MPDSAQPTAPAPPSKSRVFARRLFSTVVLWSAVLLAMFWKNRALADYVFLSVMLLLAVAGLLEFYGMAEKGGAVCFKGWGVAGGILLMSGTFFGLTGDFRVPAKDWESLVPILLVLGLCVVQLFSKTSDRGMLSISLTLFGWLYVPWLLNFIQKIQFFPGIDANGKYFVLYFIVVTKLSDTGAYVVGSLIGRHKMIPRISPGKTWEGFAGAIVIATGASLLFAHLMDGRLAGISPIHATLLGVILSVTAVVGDLIESLFKREAGVKDSGKLFPGIGGILDLLDSLLFNAPLMYLYLRYVLTHP